MPLKSLQQVSGRSLIVLITIASSCGFLLFGYDNGVFSGLLVLPWFLTTYHDPNSSLLGTISAMYNIGGFLGAIIAFLVGVRLGRKKMVLTGLGICTVGAIIQCSSTKLGQLLAGRIISGVGVGTLTSTVGLWQAEVVAGRSRGMFLTLQVVCGAAGGVFLAQWINYGFHNNNGRVAFTFPLAFQLLFIGISGLLIPILPESPRWLVKQNRRDEAREVLERLEAGSVEDHLQQIDMAVELEMSGGENQYQQLISRGPTKNLLRLCLACGTLIMHQLTGNNSVTYYMPTLLITFVKVSHPTALLVAAMTSIASGFSAMVPIFTIDRLGRRPFLWGGAAAQSILFVVIAVLVAKTQDDGDNSHAYGIGATVMLFVFYCLNAATWLGPSWAYPAEILPLQIREKGLALGNTCYWLFQFMIVEITPIAISNIGYKFYIVFAVFTAVIATIIYFFFPETKGLTLEEIDFYFVENTGGHYRVGSADAKDVALGGMARREAEHVEDA
jgi:sugar porter (SP) family MFS transporter